MTATDFSYQFDSLEKVLRAFAMKLCSNKTDADDLFQETAYRAYKNHMKFKAETNLKAWLMTIMRNTFINKYRKAKRNRTIKDWTSTDYLIDSGEYSVTNFGESNIAIEEIESMIAKLDDTLAVPFRMRSIGYRYQEIADELSMPIGTVKSRIFLARKELKYYLEKAANYN